MADERGSICAPAAALLYPNAVIQWLPNPTFLDVRNLKRRWLSAVAAARLTVATLPSAEVGCRYLGPGQRPRTPAAASA